MMRQVSKLILYLKGANIVKLDFSVYNCLFICFVLVCFCVILVDCNLTVFNVRHVELKL